LYGFPDYNNSDENILSTDQFVAVNRTISDSVSRFLNSAGIADLPGTEKEVQQIGSILLKKNIKVNTHLRHEASEKVLKRIDNPYILHIATHGFFMKDEIVIQQAGSSEILGGKTHPLMRSGLLLAGVKKSLNTQSADKDIQNEDGVFTAYEAMNLNLSTTELVVLSACETGLGEIKNGEGIYGLQRAFEIAGAKSVLMSLWTVDDAATQELMTLFYQRWTETNNKHDAFSYAQKSVKEKYKSPYYWAAFVMVGE
jgi:CHAT domain-containing protein